MATDKELEWDSLSMVNVNKFKAYMQNDLDFAQNTRAFYLALIRGAIADFYVLHDVCPYVCITHCMREPKN